MWNNHNVEKEGKIVIHTEKHWKTGEFIKEGLNATNKNIKTVVTQNPKIKIEDFEFMDSSFDVELIGTNFEDYFTTKIKNNSNYYIKEVMFKYDTCGSYTYLYLKNLEKGEIL